MKNKVAIIGRPNVGKSALFNRLIGKQFAIVEDTPGVTRDRLHSECEWNSNTFTLIDTGGIDTEDTDALRAMVHNQAYKAIAESDVILFVVDAMAEYPTPLDEEVAQILRISRKKVILALNKVDSQSREKNIYNFYSLGFGDAVSVSALHGLGTGDLLDSIVEMLPGQGQADDDEGLIKVAIVGRPNVGKSSLFNVLCGEERSIVSNMPGTTIDTIDTVINRNSQSYLFLDTAGLKKKGNQDSGIELKSYKKAISNIERAHVAVFMLDISQEITKQDRIIAGIINEGYKAVVIVVNKMDTIDLRNSKALRKWKEAYTEEIYAQFDFLNKAPVCFISAKEQTGITSVFENIDFVWQNYNKVIEKSVLCRFIQEITVINSPPIIKGKQFRVSSIEQLKSPPPSFLIKINLKKLLHYSYTRFIKNQLTSAFGFEGCPIKLIFKEKERK